MHKQFLAVSVTCCLVLGAFLLFINWVFIAQQRLSYYDANSYHQSGLKALILLLKQEKYRLAVTETLPEGFSQPLLLLSTGKIPDRERTRLLHWVKSGGMVLELSSSQPGIYPGKKKLEKDPRYNFTFLPEGSFFKAVFLSASGIRYHPKSNFLVTRNRPDQGYFRYKGNYFCYRTHYGKGSIVSWNDLDGLTNLQIKENPDNAVAFVLLLSHITASHRIKILNSTRSEFHFRLDKSLAALFDRYGSAILWIFIGIGLLLWKISVRFGRPQPLTIIRGRSYYEFLSSMAGLFQQAGIKQVVLANLWHSLWRIMRDITGLPTDAEVTRMISKLSQVTAHDYTPLNALYQQTLSDAKGSVLFLETARQLDHYRKELLQWKTSRA